MAPTEASTPIASTEPAAVNTIRQTPPTPVMAPARCFQPGRSPTSGQASIIMNSGARAMMIDARLVGRRCAAT